MFCVYCGLEKSDNEFTMEHVIPKAIGGNLQPSNLFILKNVCSICNSRCGRYVDAPYIKNWLTHNQRGAALLKYIDLSKNPRIPLTFLGTMEDKKLPDGKQCDFWLGPTGDSIYHFHLPYPDEPNVPPMVGRPTNLKDEELDPGFAFLFLRATNPAWHGTIGYSFIEQFKNSELYFGNGPTPTGGAFKDIPDTLKALHKDLRALNGVERKVSAKVSMDYGDRFIAKVALGLGALLLESSFIFSEDAKLLREALWCIKHKERENIPIFGSSFLSNKDEKIQNLLSWDGTHIITLMIIDNSLVLYLLLYGKQEAVVKISSNEKYWKDRISKNGMMFILVPGLQRYVGPIEVATYIAWKTNGYKSRELEELKTHMESFLNLPPYD